MQVVGVINKYYLNGYNATFFHTDGRLNEQPEWKAFLGRTLHLNLRRNT